MAVAQVREVPKSDNYKLGCRRCGGWGRYVSVNGYMVACDLCDGSGADPDPRPSEVIIREMRDDWPERQ